MSYTTVIAEIGVNHNGSETLARKMIDSAKKCGSDFVKFQTFKAEKSITESAEQADYQIKNTGVKESQLEMVKRLELSDDAHRRLKAYCKEQDIGFLSTAFDFESLRFLVDDLGLKRLKFPSGEITNAPLLLAHAQTGCDLIVSTGMATLSEIEMALGIIAYGYTGQVGKPTTEAFFQSYYSDAGQLAIKNKVTLLHCTTEYPAPIQDINLNAMDTMKSAFKLPVGYSDHSKGIVVPIAATAKGAVLIEKHFTLSNTMEGPDHLASLEPIEFKQMVSSIRAVEKSLGNGIKGPQASEVKNKLIARKSLVAAKAIAKGEVITQDKLGIKRPGTGRSPYDYWDVLGSIAEKDYLIDDEL